jgi:cyclase
MKRLLIAAALASISALPVPPAAAGQQQAGGKKSVRMQLLSSGASLYLLTEGGGNIVVLVRSEGVVLIDSKLRGWSQAVLDAIALVTDLPVTTIINTHAHADHAGGNAGYPDVREVIAHENAKAAMQAMEEFAGAAARALPTRTVTKQMSLFEGRDRIDLYYFGRGHTDGDLVAVLPGHGIANMGDLFPLKAVPVIDAARGGSGIALPETLSRALSEIKGVQRVVAGHEPLPPPGVQRSSLGDIRSWKDLEEYAAFTRDFVDAVREAFKAGKSPEEASASLSLPKQYAGYDMQQARATIEVIYGELRAGKN